MTPTETLRQMVRERMGMDRVCPTCHQPVGERMSLRDAGQASGVPFTGLARFVNGANITSSTFDQLAAWIGWPKP